MDVNKTNQPGESLIITRLDAIEAALALLIEDQVEAQDGAEIAADEAEERELASGNESAELEALIDSWDLRYFSGAEFTPYWDKVKNGVRNSVPPRAMWPRIAKTLVVLDRLRDELGGSIRLHSTYRSPQYNAQLPGAASGSMHKEFKAIDFSCAVGTPTIWATRLKSYRGQNFTDPATETQFQFKGGIGRYNTFVHLDTRGTNADW